jgi:ferric-dicitrate binding protein FerR (iron transport regulator)
MTAPEEASFERYFAGELDAPAVRELEEALKRDPELRKRLLRYAHEEWSLASAVRGRAGLERAPVPATRRRHALRRVGGPRLPLLLLAGLAAAGLLVAALVLAPEAPSRPAKRPEVAVDPGLPEEPRPVPPPERPAPAPPRQDAAAPADRNDREAELEKASEEFRRKVREAELRRAERPAPKAPADAAPAPAPTRAALAVVERAEASALLSGDLRTALKGGEPIVEGQGLAVEAGGRATLLYPDGTRLEIEGGTELRELRDAGGKRLRVVRGRLGASVAKQPKDRPMLFETPHGDATVLGTTLRIDVALDPAGATRLEVDEGKVRLRRPSDGKAVEVPAGHFAVTAPGTDFLPRPIPPAIALFRHDFEDGLLPSAWNMGRLGPGPLRAGSRHALEAVASPDGGVAVNVGLPRPAYRKSLRLRFRYFVGAGDRLVVLAYSQEAGDNFRTTLSPVLRKWTEVQLPLSDFLRMGDAPSPLREGHALTWIKLWVPGGPGPAHFDDIELFDVRR